MRHVVIAFLVACIGAKEGFAQPTDAIPPRFQALAKNERFKLTRILGTPELHPASGPTTAFSADGKRAVYVEDLTTGADDKPAFRSRIIVLDVQAKMWPREIDIGGKSVTALDLSADGKTAFVAGLTFSFSDKAKKPDTFLSVWDLDKGKELRALPATENAIVHVALAPDGQTGLSANLESLHLWDLKTGKVIKTYSEKDKANATCVAYLPGGKRFLAGYRGGEVRLFDIDKEKHLRSFHGKGEHEFVWHLAVAADGKRFASADFKSSVTLWETDTGKEIGTFRLEKPTIEEIITGLAIGTDGKTVYLTWGKANPEADDFACAKVYAWDAPANKVLWSSIAGYRGRVPMLVRGEALQIGGGPNNLDLWDIKKGVLVESWGGHKGPVNAIAVMNNGDIKSAGVEGILMTWRNSLEPDRQVEHKGAITALAVSKDRQQWLTAGADLMLRHGPLDAKKRPDFPKAHAGPITSLAFSGNGIWAVSSSGDRTARTWDLDARKELASFAGHSEGVNAVAISPNDRWLASGSDDASIRVWPVKDGKPDPDREVIVLEDHKKAVTCLAFSGDGKTLYSGSQDQTVKAWDWAKGKCVRTLTGHKNWITSITLVDDKTALTTSDDLTVCLWDLPSGKELGRIDFGAVGDCPRCLTRLGDRIFVGTSSWMIYEFQMLPGKSKSAGGSSK
jgi:WD40 repeat protein